MSAAYSVGANCGISNQTDGSHIARLIIQAPIKPETLDDVLKTIENELENAAKNGFEEKYISKVKEYMLKTYKENERENSSWIDYIETLKRDGFDAYTDYAKTLQSITNNDLKTLAKKFVKSGNKATIVMKPE